MFEHTYTDVLRHTLAPPAVSDWELHSSEANRTRSTSARISTGPETTPDGILAIATKLLIGSGDENAKR